MQDQVLIVTVCIAIFAVAQSSSSPVPLNSANIPPLCEPGIIEEMPPHIKKVCLALENSNQLSSALNQYIRNEGAGMYNDELASLKLIFLSSLHSIDGSRWRLGQSRRHGWKADGCGSRFPSVREALGSANPAQKLLTDPEVTLTKNENFSKRSTKIIYLEIFFLFLCVSKYDTEERNPLRNE